ncbi:MAG: fucose isomerase, partial [Lachnospiraceae bacterium]
MKTNIRIGFAPTRRAIFSAPAAVRYADLTRKKLTELGIDFVDITDVNEEGLLFDDAGREKIAAKFKEAKIDGL